jgi:hypothetical protein
VAAGVETWAQGQGSPNVYIEGRTTGINDSAYHLMGTRRIGASTTLEVRLNGAQDGANTTLDTTIDVSALGVPVSIGAHPNGQHSLQGYIAEVVAYHGTIGGLQLAQLEVYFAQKYNLH